MNRPRAYSPTFWVIAIYIVRSNQLQNSTIDIFLGHFSWGFSFFFEKNSSNPTFSNLPGVDTTWQHTPQPPSWLGARHTPPTLPPDARRSVGTLPRDSKRCSWGKLAKRGAGAASCRWSWTWRRPWARQGVCFGPCLFLAPGIQGIITRKKYKAILGCIFLGVTFQCGVKVWSVRNESMAGCEARSTATWFGRLWILEMLRPIPITQLPTNHEEASWYIIMRMHVS